MTAENEMSTNIENRNGNEVESMIGFMDLVTK
jgi:hypothetical protein